VRQSDRPNAIQLDSLPDSLARDIGLSDQPDLQRIVGLDPVTHEQIRSTEENLAQAPPVRFDLSRQVRVFTTMFQFVEFELKGCYISRKKVKMPSYLVGLSGDREVESRFHAQFDLIDNELARRTVDSGMAVTEGSLKEKKLRIARQFMIQLKRFGTVVMRANKAAFVAAVDDLRLDVKKFQKEIESFLEKQISESVKRLTEALLPSVVKSPPEDYMRYIGSHPSMDQIEKALTSDLERAFGKASDHIGEMSVSLVFKDVAYESLADVQFLSVAKQAIPGLETWYEEFDALRTNEEEEE